MTPTIPHPRQTPVVDKGPSALAGVMVGVGISIVLWGMIAAAVFAVA